MAAKNCSKCGAAFTCRNEKPGCWCEGLHLDAKALEHLKKEFDNCLCLSCLEVYAVEEGTRF